jgi:hypothetical protein
MDEPATATSAPPPPHISKTDLWTAALGPLPGVAVLLALSFVAIRLVRRYVERE